MSKLAPLTTEKIIHFKNSFSFPNIWCVAYAQFAFNEVRDGTHDSPKQSEKGVPLITSKNLTNGFIDFTNTKIISLEDHLEISKRSGVSTGDLLFSMIGTIGNVAPVPENTHFSVKNVGLFRKNDSLLNRRFSFHWLRSQPYQKYLGDHKRGGNQKFVSLGVLRESPIPIPPLCEQKVIADKLDTLLAQVDNTKARLERIPEILKRFRQSVLAAAVSGRLTGLPDDIFKPTPVEQLAKKQKYSLGIGPFGSNLKVSDYRKSGHPLVFVREVRATQFGDNATKFVSSEKFQELKAHRVLPGDILITKMGDPPGDVAIYPLSRPEAVITADCIKLSVDESFACRDYVAYAMQSEQFRLAVLSISAGVAQQKVNLTKFRKLELQLPPLSEQAKIVSRVDQLFSHADRIEQQVNQALARVNNLTQSILAKAFRGELTEQWRKDNPELISGENAASALLERIKAERAAKTPAKRTRKKATA